MREGRLVALPWDLSELSFSAQLLWHREKWISPSMGAFIHTAKSELKTKKYLAHKRLNAKGDAHKGMVGGTELNLKSCC
ncbi:hypothetical protein P5G61_16770 [Paenibacillus sp. F6_3S_P_1C]|uniref:LysR substrate-binding domain-containing protein n=1 Tax=Paenibacillus vandeheii TaxID=3035917 RepID=A0ABT8JFE4_9BACL|nr:hypothetical protein [Paenibacillus vandeheii]MDN4602894.1 hypothetical protein [Paenibacillus vandeheii]